jgi:hypothetical protein
MAGDNRRSGFTGVLQDLEEEEAPTLKSQAFQVGSLQ